MAPSPGKHCAEKRRLLDAYHGATVLFSQRLSDLNDRIGTSTRAEYEALRRRVDTERVASEQARLALECHVADRGC